jgi:hypothetical protein
VGRIELAWHGSNHSPDNIYIHFPDHDTLMLVDIVLPGWAPFYGINLSEDVPGYMNAPATALSYPWKHLIAGHLGRLGTRDDVTLHQQYIADIEAGARSALGTVDPTPYFQKYGDNLWAAVKGYLDAMAVAAAGPSSRSTSACSEQRTYSRSRLPSRSWSRSAWTSATAWTSHLSG